MNLAFGKCLFVILYPLFKELCKNRPNLVLLNLIQIFPVFEKVSFFYNFELGVILEITFLNYLKLISCQGSWYKLDELCGLNRPFIVVEVGDLSLLGKGEFCVNRLVLNQILFFVNLDYKLILGLIGDLRVAVVPHMLILYRLINVIGALGGHSLAQGDLGEIIGKLLLVVVAVEGKLLVALILEMEHQLTVVEMELLLQLLALLGKVLVECANVLVQNVQNLVRECLERRQDVEHLHGLHAAVGLWLLHSDLDEFDFFKSVVDLLNSSGFLVGVLLVLG